MSTRMDAIGSEEQQSQDEELYRELKKKKGLRQGHKWVKATPGRSGSNGILGPFP